MLKASTKIQIFKVSFKKSPILKSNEFVFYIFIILVSQVIESSVVSICVCRESEIVGFGAFDSRKDFENLSGLGTKFFSEINIVQLTSLAFL